MPANSKKVRITAWLPNELYYRMHRASLRFNISHTDYVAMALSRSLEHDEKCANDVSKMLDGNKEH